MDPKVESTFAPRLYVFFYVTVRRMSITADMKCIDLQIGHPLQVFVRDNNVDQALRVLKKKMQREGIFREMKARRSYEKPSERKIREKAEAVRRNRKAARKQAIREGLIAAPKKPSRPTRPSRSTQPGSPPPAARQ